MSLVRALAVGVFASIMVSAGVGADPPLAFTNIVGSGSGAEGYARVPSHRYQGWLAAMEQSLVTPLTFAGVTQLSAQARGLSGVVIFDYDGDGDLDLFVTDGPGGSNALLDVTAGSGLST